MSLCSIWYITFLSVLAIAYHLLPWRGARQLLLSVVNSALLVPLVPNWQSWAGFAFFIGMTFAVVRLVKDRPPPHHVGLAIGLFVLFFVFFKRYSFLDPILGYEYFDHSTEIVGLSYILFKAIHVIVDEYQGQLGPCDFITYANYQLSFFTLLAGPIQRYNDFRRSWDEMDMGCGDAGEDLRSWSRILTGMIKMGALAPIAWSVFEGAGWSNWFSPMPGLMRRFAMYFYGYPFYLYFNFSGYTDIAIGSARLLGFPLPENFNRPFLARNIIDFWNRWHITLTHWIRDYIFMLSYKGTAERFPASARYAGYGLLFSSLFLSGVWHGSTANFAVFGAVHGLGAAANQAYGDILKARLGRAGFRRYLESRMYRRVAILATFHYICFSFLFFSSDIRKALDILGGVGRALLSTRLSDQFVRPGPAASAAMALLPILFLAAWKGHAALEVLDRSGRRLNRFASPLRIVLVKTVLVVVLFLSLWALRYEDPVVVYVRF